MSARGYDKFIPERIGQTPLREISALPPRQPSISQGNLLYSQDFSYAGPSDTNPGDIGPDFDLYIGSNGLDAIGPSLTDPTYTWNGDPLALPDDVVGPAAFSEEGNYCVIAQASTYPGATSSGILRVFYRRGPNDWVQIEGGIIAPGIDSAYGNPFDSDLNFSAISLSQPDIYNGWLPYGITEYDTDDFNPTAARVYLMAPFDDTLSNGGNHTKGCIYQFRIRTAGTGGRVFYNEKRFSYNTTGRNATHATYMEARRLSDRMKVSGPLLLTSLGSGLLDSGEDPVDTSGTTIANGGSLIAFQIAGFGDNPDDPGDQFFITPSTFSTTFPTIAYQQAHLWSPDESTDIWGKSVQGDLSSSWARIVVSSHSLWDGSSTYDDAGTAGHIGGLFVLHWDGNTQSFGTSVESQVDSSTAMTSGSLATTESSIPLGTITIKESALVCEYAYDAFNSGGPRFITGTRSGSTWTWRAHAPSTPPGWTAHDSTRQTIVCRPDAQRFMMLPNSAAGYVYSWDLSSSLTLEVPPSDPDTDHWFFDHPIDNDNVRLGSTTVDQTGVYMYADNSVEWVWRGSEGQASPFFGQGLYVAAGPTGPFIDRSYGPQASGGGAVVDEQAYNGANARTTFSAVCNVFEPPFDHAASVRFMTHDTWDISNNRCDNEGYVGLIMFADREALGMSNGVDRSLIIGLSIDNGAELETADDGVAFKVEATRNNTPGRVAINNEPKDAAGNRLRLYKSADETVNATYMLTALVAGSRMQVFFFDGTQSHLVLESDDWIKGTGAEDVPVSSSSVFSGFILQSVGKDTSVDTGFLFVDDFQISSAIVGRNPVQVSVVGVNDTSVGLYDSQGAAVLDGGQGIIDKTMDPMFIGSTGFVGIESRDALMLTGREYYVVSTAARTLVKAKANFGDFPEAVGFGGTSKCRYGTVFNNRLVLYGLDPWPNNWYMSRSGDWLDHDVTSDQGRFAVSGDTTDTGVPPDAISCMHPITVDTMAVASLNSIRVMRGDPVDGGFLDDITDKNGIVGPRAATRDDEGNFFFLSYEGMFVIPNDGTFVPRPITRDRYSEVCNDVDWGVSIPRLIWNPVERGIYISIWNSVTGVARVAFYNPSTDFLSPDLYSHGVGFASAASYYSADTGRRNFLIGGNDGYVRQQGYAYDTDDGADIQSEVLVGPFVGGDNSRVVVGGMGLRLAKPEQACTVALLSADGADQVKDATANASLTVAGDRSVRSYSRTGGAAVGILVSGATGKSWSLAKLDASVEKQGALSRTNP